MPNSSSWSLGPIPDSINSWGDLMAPEHSTTRSPKTWKASPPLTASTPMAWRPSNRIFWTYTSPRTVRLRRWRMGLRWARAELMRTPPRLLVGAIPTPVGLAPLVSSTKE